MQCPSLAQMWASGGGISLATLDSRAGQGLRSALGTRILHNLGITKTRSNTLTHLRESLRKCHLSVSGGAELNLARVTEKEQVSAVLAESRDVLRLGLHR